MTAILYGSRTKLTNAHKPVFTRSWPPKGATRQPEYYVRMDTTHLDMVEALDKAKPMEGETVLNTVDLGIE